MTLDTPEKVQDIQKQIGYGIVESNILFVNALKGFYSENNEFAWGSGERLGNLDSNDECMYSNKSHRKAISCEIEMMSMPLICQQNSQRIYSLNRELTPSFAKYNGISHNATSNSLNETCDYYTVVRENINWYVAKYYCESRNSELLGVPTSEECPIVQNAQSLRGNPALFLNVHRFLYNRNSSVITYNDRAYRAIGESECEITQNLPRQMTPNRLCIEFYASNSIPLGCSSSQSNGQVVFICKKCPHNQHNPQTSASESKESKRELKTSMFSSLSDPLFPLKTGEYSGFSAHLHLIVIGALVALTFIFFWALIITLLYIRYMRLSAKSRTRVESAALAMRYEPTPPAPEEAEVPVVVVQAERPDSMDEYNWTPGVNGRPVLPHSEPDTGAARMADGNSRASDDNIDPNYNRLNQFSRDCNVENGFSNGGPMPRLPPIPPPIQVPAPAQPPAANSESGPENRNSGYLILYD